MKAKKIFKGMTAAAVAAVLAASMVPMTAFAAAPGYDDLSSQAVTMPDTLAKAKYNVYLVASAAHKTDDATGVYEYKLETGFTSVAGLAVDDNKRLTYNGSVLSTSTPASNVKELADALETASSGASTVAGGSNLASGSSLTLAPGYYLVTTTGTQMKSAPILVSVTNAAKTLTAKSSDLTFEKNIVNVSAGQGTVDGTADKHKTAEVAVGSEVEYEIKTNFPSYSAEVVTAVKKEVDPLNITDFVITDDPSRGITLRDIVVKVDDTVVVASNSTYSLNKNVTTGTNGGTGFTITFADPYVVDHQNKSVVVSFKADVNSNADSQTAIPNDAILNFDNAYATGGGNGELKDETDIYRTDLIINKTDEANHPIQGVGFKVYKAVELDGAVTKGAVIGLERFTGADGKITITDLPAGKYIISETTVPDNYKKAADVTITIEATKDTASNTYTGAYKFTGTDKISDTENSNMKTIVNIKGQELPGTGGMGTIIFTVAGAGVVLVAGIMLIVYMKKRKIEE